MWQLTWVLKRKILEASLSVTELSLGELALAWFVEEKKTFLIIIW